MNYQSLSEGLEFFTDVITTEFIEPVHFLNHPNANIRKQIYDRRAINNLFEAKAKVRQDLEALRNNPVELDLTIEAAEERMADFERRNDVWNTEYDRLKKIVEDKDFNPNEIICPLTHAGKLTKNGMEPHLSYLLFRNIFLVTADEAIKRNLGEFYENGDIMTPKEETKRFLEIFKNCHLQENDIQAAKEALKQIENGTSNWNMSHPEYIEELKKWEIINTNKAEKEEVKLGNIMVPEQGVGEEVDEEMKLALEISRLTFEEEKRARDRSNIGNKAPGVFVQYPSQDQQLWNVASKGNWIEATKLLKKGGQDLNFAPPVGENKGLTALWFALRDREWNLAAELLINGAKAFDISPAQGDYQGQTELWFATYYQQWDIVDLLMKRGAKNVHAGPANGACFGQTVLSVAESHKKKNIFSSLRY